MSLIRRNVFANFVGGGLLAVMTLVITPLQIRILGMEAFGIVGFIVTLQMAFTAFDFGLSNTVTREIAADSSVGKSESDALIRTAMTVYGIAAILLGGTLVVLAGPIARSWFNPETMEVVELEQSLRVIALYLAMRWPVALYVGILSGFQRMDILNVIKVAMTSVRLLGGILVLLQWRSLDAFLWWTAANAVLEVVAYDIACRRVHPGLPLRPGFSIATVRRIWRYSASLNVLSILAVLIVQADRLVISETQTLEVLGYYSLAYTTASVVVLLIGAVSSAVFPWFTEAHEAGDPGLLKDRYSNASWAMMFVVGLAAPILIFYGHFLLALWVSEQAADSAGTATALLAAGFWVGAAVSVGYNAALAQGRPRRPLVVGALSFVPYVAAIYLLVDRWGANGAALAWLLLQVSNAVLLVPFITRRVIGTELKPWLTRIVLPLLLLAGLAFGSLKLISVEWLGGGFYANAATLSLATLIYLFVGYRISPTPLLNAKLRNLFGA